MMTTQRGGENNSSNNNNNAVMSCVSITATTAQNPNILIKKLVIEKPKIRKDLANMATFS